MSKKKLPGQYIRKDRIVPGVGRVLTMSDARQIVVQPTKTFVNASKFLDAVFKIKSAEKINKKRGDG